MAEPDGREHGIHLFHDANLRLAAALLPFTALMFAAAPLFIPALFTHRYDASVPIFRIAMLATPFAALPVEAVLRATGQTRFVFQAFFWKLVVTVPAVLLGLRVAGMEGAITGQVIAEVTIRYVMLARVRTTLGCSFHDVLPWGELGELAVASIVASAPVVLIARSAHAGPRPFLALCAAGAAYAVVYLGALALKPGAGTPVAKVKRVLLGTPA
jgi:O-antigen/teichoic acid export membrane protein